MSETTRGREAERTASETEMERGRLPRETYAAQPYETGYGSGTGYGQQVSETGGTTASEQPTWTESLQSTFTGKTPEEQRYPRERSYETRETGTGTGAGLGTGGGSLADSMRSTYSSRPGLDTTKYEEHKQPTTGERVKAMFTGRSAPEQHEYERGRERERERGSGTGYGTSGTGYGTGREHEQPTIKERVEATFTGRTAQQQHEHDALQREMQRSRGGSSEPGVMATRGGMFTSTEPTGRRASLGERMKESIHEIRTSLTGGKGEGYTPIQRSDYTPQRTRGSGSGY